MGRLAKGSETGGSSHRKDGEMGCSHSLAFSMLHLPIVRKVLCKGPSPPFFSMSVQTGAGISLVDKWEWLCYTDSWPKILFSFGGFLDGSWIIGM